MQMFKLFSLWNKKQSKKKERNGKNNFLIDFRRGHFLDSKAKTGEIAVYILRVLWEFLSC